MQKGKKHLTKDTFKLLRGATQNERLLHRLHCVIAVENGLSSSETGRFYGASPRAVAYWVTQFRKNGVEGLKEEVRPGRPTTLNPDQATALQNYIKRQSGEKEPVTSRMVADYLFREFKITVSPHLAWRILKKLSF